MLVGSPQEPSKRNYLVFQPLDPSEDPATASTDPEFGLGISSDGSLPLWVIKSLGAFASSPVRPKHHRVDALCCFQSLTSRTGGVPVRIDAVFQLWVWGVCYMAVDNQAPGHSSVTPCVRYDAPGSQHTQAAPCGQGSFCSLVQRPQAESDTQSGSW